MKCETKIAGIENVGGTDLEIPDNVVGYMSRIYYNGNQYFDAHNSITSHI